ncbi:MAG: hypothetical protein QNJ65_24050 [Xenococcaceae cyanobacterium MO_234.B1]|nr:hypothetical protein [Xenococcaceae cyanobacterium MO_234.B1]
MRDRSVPIYFYIPEADLPTDLPVHADTYWVGFRRGIYCWTLQTYLRLKAEDFPGQLVGKLPEEGIIISHWDSLPPDLQPNSRQLIICCQADRSRHNYAQIHIVQNPTGLDKNLMVLGDRFFLAGYNYYLPLWVQPGLIKRDVNRGNLFQNIAFFGSEKNLLPELQQASWQQQVQELGLNWQVISDFNCWHDYREIDAILAVRSFSKTDFTWKPAAKLYNAWHAGVPAILGRESAYRAERKSELDYLEVGSIADIITALKKLRDNPNLYQKMISNGSLRAQETIPAKLTARWKHLILQKLIPIYTHWCNSPWYRQTFLLRRQWAIETRKNRQQLQQIRNNLGLGTRMRSLLSGK